MKLMLTCCLLVLAATLSAAAPRYVKSNAVTRVKLTDTSASFVHVHRRRRQSLALTPSQEAEILDHHNVLRAMEGADNMELMVRTAWSCDYCVSK